MEYKTFSARSEDLDDRTIKGIAAVFGNVDMANDRIHLGAFKKTIKEGDKRIKHLWAHDIYQPPVAKVLEVAELKRSDLPPEIVDQNPDVTGGLSVTRKYLNTPRGEEILAGIKAGAITDMSFGFDPVKFSFTEDKDTGVLVRDIQELRLWDISDVNWGMNPLTMASKSAIPYKDTGKASEGTAWSAPNLGDFTDGKWEDLTAAEKSRITGHYAFTINSPAESFGDLKLPHHSPSSSGIGAAVWNGVKAAMGALMGARGGVSIPDADRKSVYNHLVNHYKQFEKEPPDYKIVDFMYLGNTLELKEGRVLSGKNLEKLKNALEVLNSLLLDADPADKDEASKSLVNVKKIMQKIQLMERDPILLGR